MKNILSLKIFLLLLFPFTLSAQIEKVIVETYYISDSSDATDTIGGGLQAGSVTYRIYIDMKAGSLLRKIYGDANHALKFSSTENFFNNKSDGQTFAKDFAKSRYAENTVALDSWITLGQTTRLSSKTYFGVLKSQDRDGSFIGGNNNDGGSAAVVSGLMVNVDDAAGIPITTSDGMDTMTVRPSSWADEGFLSSSGDDSTIFGSLVCGKQFVSNYAQLQNSGVSGVNADSNIVLVAQMTTKGEISFELNVELEIPDGASTKIVQYVSDASVLLHNDSLDEYECAFLKYPAACGCKDPNYLEYSESYSCANNDSCRTHIVFGCMDVNACNYNSLANFHVASLCCYPGLCNDRDIASVCPELNVQRKSLEGADVYPNPVHTFLNVSFEMKEKKEIRYEIYNSLGKIISKKDIGVVSGNFSEEINVDAMTKGIYLIRFYEGDNCYGKMFVKE